MTPLTSLMILFEIVASTSYGMRAQSAVMKSCDSTARIATTDSYVLPSPMTPTVCTGSSTANTCAVFWYRPLETISSRRISSCVA